MVWSLPGAVKAETTMGPSVLIVDSDPDTRLLYRTALAPVTDAITEAEDGADALGKIFSARPNVVITETRLQRVDGFSLCSLLRAEPATRSAGIVVVTADSRAGDTARATNAGADEVLIKPCTVEAVVDAVLRSWSRCQIRATVGESDRPSQQRGRATKVRDRDRFVTRQPPRQPPELRCPQCDRQLQYDRSHVGGVNDAHPEQWDYFVCGGGCGTFQYRQRTRTVRQVGQSPDGAWTDVASPPARRARSFGG